MFFNRLFRSTGTVFRMGKEFITRQCTRVWAAFRRATSLTSLAAKAAPKALEGLAAAGSKPTKRSDYVETNRLFISKSFIVMAIIVIIAVTLLMVNIVWPWLTSMFWVCKMPETDARIANYSGMVELYYDTELTELKFKGTLEKGVKKGAGTLYNKKGDVIYEGGYANDVYSGAGKTYDTAGYLTYDGLFENGVREGAGKEYTTGTLVYEGAFSKGLREGSGKLYASGRYVSFEGAFAAGSRTGNGREYDENHNLIFAGSYSGDSKNGQGTAYYANGDVLYKGNYLNDHYDGEGALYFPNGVLQYKGGFHQGKYDGDGVLYLSATEWKSGAFEEGTISGAMIWFKNSRLYYDGAAVASLPDGAGKLYNAAGKVVYDGAFAEGCTDLRALLGKTADDVRTTFAQATIAEHELASGFVIENADAGISAFCFYATADSAPTVSRTYAWAGAAAVYTGLPEERAFSAYTPPDEALITGRKLVTGKKTDLSAGIPYAGKTLDCSEIYYADYSYYVWCEGESIVMLEWLGTGKAPDKTGGGASESAADSNARLLELLDGLGL